MEPELLGWEPLLLSWLNKLPTYINNDFYKIMIYNLFIRFCKPLLWLIRKGGVRVSDFLFIYLLAFVLNTNFKTNASINKIYIFHHVSD